jgi:hypothetical protein
MLGWFRFKTHRAYYPDGAVALAEKSGAALALADARLAQRAAVFLDPAEGMQMAVLGHVQRERLHFPSQGFVALEEKSGSNVTVFSAMQGSRVLFRWWDAYRFTDIPEGIKKCSAWVGLLRTVGALVGASQGR